jgi:hypothetical protein
LAPEFLLKGLFTGNLSGFPLRSKRAAETMLGHGSAGTPEIRSTPGFSAPFLDLPPNGVSIPSMLLKQLTIPNEIDFVGPTVSRF